MKKFNLLGVMNSLFLIALPLFLIYCSKSGISPTPPPSGGTVNSTITVSASPISPLWYGTNTWIFEVSSSKATGVAYSINGGAFKSVTNGQVILSNLEQTTTVEFKTIVTDGINSVSTTRNVDVYTLNQSNIEKYGSWKEYMQEVDTTASHSGNFMPSTVPICDQDDINSFDNKTTNCTTNYGAMTCGLPPSGTAHFEFKTVGGIPALEWKNPILKTVSELTSTSFVFIERVYSAVHLHDIDVKHYLKH
jgi:hypothetical protein